MPWNKVNKPTGVNWTNIPKPTESSVVTGQSDAQPFGLLIAITSVFGGGTVTSITSGWTDVNKPTSSVWTLVTKPID